MSQQKEETSTRILFFQAVFHRTQCFSLWIIFSQEDDPNDERAAVCFLGRVLSLELSPITKRTSSASLSDALVHKFGFHLLLTFVFLARRVLGATVGTLGGEISLLFLSLSLSAFLATSPSGRSLTVCLFNLFSSIERGKVLFGEEKAIF